MDELSYDDKVMALVDFFGMSEDEARAMLEDMGEYDD